MAYEGSLIHQSNIDFDSNEARYQPRALRHQLNYYEFMSGTTLDIYKM